MQPNIRARHILCAFFFLTGGVGVSPLSGQQPDGAGTGVRESQVVGAEGLAPLGDAMLFVQIASRGAVSDAQGNYRIVGLAAGPHTIVAQRVGLGTERRTIEVAVGVVTRADFTLREAATIVAPIIVSASREWQRRTEA